MTAASSARVARPRVMGNQPALPIALEPVLSGGREQVGGGVVCFEEAVYGATVMTTERMGRPSERQDVGGTSPRAGDQLTLPLSFGGRGARAVSSVGGACSTGTAPTMASTGPRRSERDGARPSSSSPADGREDTWAGPSPNVGAISLPVAGASSEAGDRPTTPVVVAVVQADPGLACPGRRQADDVTSSETDSDVGQVMVKAEPSPERPTRDTQALTDQAGKGPWPSKWSPRTVRHLHSCLRVGFGDAIRDGIPLTVNPTVGVILPELAVPHRISLNDEERTELIEESLRRENGQPVHRLGDLIAFLALTGLRSGEARALTFDDVDLGKREASITKTIAIGDTSRLSIGPPKRKSSTRSVALPTLAVKIIQARADEVGISRSELGPYRSSRETIQIGARYYDLLTLPEGALLPTNTGEKRALTLAVPSSRALIWMTRNSTPLDHQAVRKALHEVIRSVDHFAFDRFRCGEYRWNKIAGPRDWKGAPLCAKCQHHHWPEFWPHVLRGAAISFWLRHQQTAVAAAARAGHSDPRMILQYYASSTRDEDRQMASLDD